MPVPRDEQAPDILDVLGHRLLRLLDPSSDEMVSPAPGAGPEADREGNRVRHSGRIGSHRTRGEDAEGYGGHGDSITVVDQPSEDVSEYVKRYLHRIQMKGLHQPKPAGRIRLAKPFSPEAHIDNEYQYVAGPYGLFDGTIGAPSAGNSLVPVPITLPTNVPSPVMLLDRYPSAMYMSILVRTFAVMPTGTTTTGLQEYYFADPGGAVVPLGIYNAAGQNNGIQSIGGICTTPLTDPGNIQIGTLFVNNIGIGGTPTSIRWQLGITFVAYYPDPWFNEQVVVPAMPSEIEAYLRSSGAQGN